MAHDVWADVLADLTCDCQAKIQAQFGEMVRECYHRQAKVLGRAQRCTCGDSAHHQDCGLRVLWPETSHGPVHAWDRPAFTMMTCDMVGPCRRCQDRLRPLA